MAGEVQQSRCGQKTDKPDGDIKHLTHTTKLNMGTNEKPCSTETDKTLPEMYKNRYKHRSKFKNEENSIPEHPSQILKSSYTNSKQNSKQNSTQNSTQNLAQNSRKSSQTPSTSFSSKSSKSKRPKTASLLAILSVTLFRPINSEFHTPKFHKTSVDYMKSRGASSIGFTTRTDISSAVVTGDPRVLLISSDENLYEVSFGVESTGQVQKYR